MSGLDIDFARVENALFRRSVSISLRHLERTYTRCGGSTNPRCHGVLRLSGHKIHYYRSLLLGGEGKSQLHHFYLADS